MADCGEILISCPTITCESDLQPAFTALCNATQTALNQLKACIEAYEVSEMDICTAKDDLKDPACHLSVDMMDFTGILYAENAGVGILPYPSGGLDWRWGEDETASAVDQAGGWESVTIVFDTPFDTTCVWAGITPYESFDCAPDPCGEVYQVRAPWVDQYTAASIRVWIKGDEFADESKIRFKYVAAGY